MTARAIRSPSARLAASRRVSVSSCRINIVNPNRRRLYAFCVVDAAVFMALVNTVNFDCRRSQVFKVASRTYLRPVRSRPGSSSVWRSPRLQARRRPAAAWRSAKAGFALPMADRCDHLPLGAEARDRASAENVKPHSVALGLDCSYWSSVGLNTGSLFVRGRFPDPELISLIAFRPYWQRRCFLRGSGFVRRRTLVAVVEAVGSAR